MAQIKKALVTGASSGIGEAYAIRFAQAGYQLVLIASNEERLMAVAKKCEAINNIPVIIIVADLTKIDSPENIYQQLQKQNLTIDVLVNNAGVGLLDNFISQDFRKISHLIQLNITALTHLTHLILPQMQQRGSGKIVNIGSVYSYVPVPRQAIYAASKAFVLSFSLALADEVKNYGISVTIICPGSTITNFHARSGSKKPSRRFTMSAAEVANQSFTAIEKGKLIFIPGGINRIFVSVASLLPRRFLSSFVKWLVYRVRDFD